MFCPLPEALFPVPPPTLEKSPLAVLPSPPLTVASPPLAVLSSPPVIQRRVIGVPKVSPRSFERPTKRFVVPKILNSEGSPHFFLKVPIPL